MKVETMILEWNTDYANVACKSGSKTLTIKVSGSQATAVYPRLSVSDAIEKVARKRFKAECQPNAFTGYD